MIHGGSQPVPEPSRQAAPVAAFESFGVLPGVSLVQKPENYASRFPVPDRFIEWHKSFEGYQPNLAVGEDLERLDALSGDVPINPVGRTGLIGRGNLFFFGANRTSDAMVIRQAETGHFEALMIQRSDGSWAFPGGFRDRNEPPDAAMARELFEEAIKTDHETRRMLEARARLLYEGYADDPRNTDNAWIETSAYLIPLSFAESQRLELSARSDAQAVDWKPLTGEFVAGLYAGHPHMASLALRTVEKDKPRSDSPVIRSLQDLTDKGMNRIGILGGSFDPFHEGHLDAGEAAMQAYHLDAVVFIPGKQNPLKDSTPHFSTGERFERTAEEVGKRRRLYVSPIEIQRTSSDPSYLVQTLRELKQEAPLAELFFVLGADTLPELDQWRQIEECMERATFVPIKRSGFRREEILEMNSLLGSDRKRELFQNFVDAATTRISSSSIRERLNSGLLGEDAL